MPDISPRTMLSSLLKTPTRVLSVTKDVGRGVAILCYQALTKPLVVVTVTTCPASALSVMDMPAVGMDQSLFDLCFREPSHDGGGEKRKCYLP